jgi:hypothetical protein
MKKFLLVGVVCALAFAPFAVADNYYYSVTITGTDISGTGTIGVDSVKGQLDIVDGSFGFTNSGDGSAATGTLVADTLSTGTVEYYDVTTRAYSTSGTSLTDNYIYYDDILTSATHSPYLDDNGVLVALSNGEYLNIFSYDGVDYWAEFLDGSSEANGQLGPDTADLSLEATVATPEPSSLLLLGTGLLAVAGLFFWKTRLKLVKEAA